MIVSDQSENIYGLVLENQTPFLQQNYKNTLSKYH